MKGVKTYLLTILVLSPLICAGQVTYNEVSALYQQHTTNVQTGRRQLELSENDAVRIALAGFEMLFASAQGYATDSINKWKNIIDGVLGETTGQVILSYDAVPIQYYDYDTLYVDSIYLTTSGQWIKYVITADSIRSLAIDTTESHTFTSLSAGNFIINGVGISDSAKTLAIDTVESHTFSSLAAGDFTLEGESIKSFVPDTVENHEFTSLTSTDVTVNGTLYSDGNLDIREKGLSNKSVTIGISGTFVAFWEKDNVGSDGMAIYPGVSAVLVSGGLALTWNGSILKTPVDTFASIDTVKTLISSLAAVANGSQYAIQLSNGDGTLTSDGDFTIQGDSARLKNVAISGGIRWYKFAGADTFGIYGLPNGTIDTLKYTGSKWMLSKPHNRHTFYLFYSDRDTLGELNWPRWDGDVYHRVSPAYYIEQFMQAHERTWGNIDFLYRENSMLKRKIRSANNKSSATLAILLAFSIFVLLKRQK